MCLIETGVCFITTVLCFILIALSYSCVPFRDCCAELGTRQHCRDNVTMCLGHTIFANCIMYVFLLTIPHLHILEFFLSLKLYYVVFVLSRNKKIVACPALLLCSLCIFVTGLCLFSWLFCTFLRLLCSVLFFV